MTRNYAQDTSLTHLPSMCGGFSRARALCSDGKVRSVRFSNGGHADTFFSIPGSVRVKGRTVTGYVSLETNEGTEPETVRFHSYTYGKNGSLLP